MCCHLMLRHWPLIPFYISNLENRHLFVKAACLPLTRQRLLYVNKVNNRVFKYRSWKTFKDNVVKS